MSATRIFITLLFLASTSSAFAETPGSLLNGYAAEAQKISPGFKPSAQRGQAFFIKDWGISQKMPSCATCHGKDLSGEGKHVITGKNIAPFSPKANPQRFSSTAKVEKWFRRNCSEVVGRECTAAEKADFIQYVSQGG
jgi:hypothetical protein